MKFIDVSSQYQAYKKEIDLAVHRVLDSGQFILGQEVVELEASLAEYVGAERGIGVSSGTDGLLLALMALDVLPGDEIITTPFTFIATAEAIALLGARPVFVDIDPVTCNMDVGLLEETVRALRAAGSRLRGVIPVGLYGQCADMDEIERIAGEWGLFVLEDACQSFGAVYRGRRSCAFGSAGVTSFFPSKPLGGYGDGGMVFTSDARMADRICSLRVHGQVAQYSHRWIGVNGRLDAIQAAVLRAKFPHFPEELLRRERAAGIYTERIRARLPEVAPPAVREDRSCVFAQYTVRVPADLREGMVDFLKERGIPTAVHYPAPLHLQQAFTFLGYGPGAFPRAEQASLEVLSLPMHPFLEPPDQERIVETMKEAVETLVVR